MARTLTAKRARTILWGKLDWHPAVHAWIAFADGAGMPDKIEVLRDGQQPRYYGSRQESRECVWLFFQDAYSRRHHAKA